LLLSLWPDQGARLLLRAALHIGHISALLGFAAYREYGAGPSPADDLDARNALP
jgi:hypothetical protein